MRGRVWLVESSSSAHRVQNSSGRVKKKSRHTKQFCSPPQSSVLPSVCCHSCHILLHPPVLFCYHKDICCDRLRCLCFFLLFLYISSPLPQYFFFFFCILCGLWRVVWPMSNKVHFSDIVVQVCVCLDGDSNQSYSEYLQYIENGNV